MRAPPPVVKSRADPLADRLADWRNAAARSMPTASSSPRRLEERRRARRSASAPWSRRSASSAESPRSRCRSSLKRRVPTGMSRVRIGTPSSRMFTLVSFVADVDQADDTAHRLGIVELEGVVQREGVDVDDAGLEPDVGRAATACSRPARAWPRPAAPSSGDLRPRDPGSGSRARRCPCRTARAARPPSG